MSKYLGPVCRLCRREGEKLYLKGERCFTPKCSFERREFAPGQHGRDRRWAQRPPVGLCSTTARQTESAPDLRHL